MTDHLTENARLRAALEKALNYIENTESELGITLDCGDTARAALATPAPDAVQEAARVLLDDEGRALPRLVEIAEAQWDAGSSMSRCIGAALRAIAESEASHDRT